MGKVFAVISMSLDGFVAGPNESRELGLGEGGEQLHEWMFSQSAWRESHGLAGGETDVNAAFANPFGEAGAVVVGKRMFDLADGWGETPPFHKPVFVLTHHRLDPEERAGGTTYTFVNDGIEQAVAQARTAAGDRDVAIGGGASIIQQSLTAGLLDALIIHVAPVLLGDGVRLFGRPGTYPVRIEPERVVDGGQVAHLVYRVRPAASAPIS